MVGQRVNRYGVGDHYDWHVDMAHMEGVRTDLSYTLFLSAPGSYQGGELELAQGNQVFSVKGEPGQVFVYPTGVRHRVKPLTEGSRLCLVGWIQSFVAHPEQRELLFSLVAELAVLKRAGAAPESLGRLQACYQGFLRALSI